MADFVSNTVNDIHGYFLMNVRVVFLCFIATQGGTGVEEKRPVVRGMESGAVSSVIIITSHRTQTGDRLVQRFRDTAVEQLISNHDRIFHPNNLHSNNAEDGQSQQRDQTCDDFFAMVSKIGI